MAALLGCRARAAGWRLGCAGLPLATRSTLLAGRSALQLSMGPPLTTRGAVSTGKIGWVPLVGAAQAVPARAGLATAVEGLVSAAPARPAAACIRPPAGSGLLVRAVVPRGNTLGERHFSTKSSQTFRKRFKLKPNGRLQHVLHLNTPLCLFARLTVIL
jgi:hypothetical protein